MRLTVAIAVSCLAFTGFSVADLAAAAIRKPIDIPPQRLGAALQSLAAKGDLQVLYRTDIVGARNTGGAVGELTVDEALTHLLSGTGLTFRYLDDKTVTIEPAPTAVQPAPTGVGPPARQEGKMVEEVIVTGSRLTRTEKEGAQPVKVYTREQIDHSGQTTVTDFLNTLPSVSVANHPTNFATNGIDSTVQLHGLPVGSTLVLLNGRRVEGAGTASVRSGQDFFNLDTIPLAAIERVEVVSEGSSAIYGSDAIAGVINVILKNDYDGAQVDLKYGAASGNRDWGASANWGKRWDRGSLSVLANAREVTELLAARRKLSATDDKTAFGGIDNRGVYCNPGNVYSLDGTPLPGAPAGSNATYAAVSGSATQGRPALTDFEYGELNKCSLLEYSSLISPQEQYGLLAQGTYSATSNVELFTELLYSHLNTLNFGNPLLLYGTPDFQLFTASADNPFNPFGQTVGVSYMLSDLGRYTTRASTEFTRTLIGAKGSLADAWQWETAAWYSRDDSHFGNSFTSDEDLQSALNSTDPVTALNPFTAGRGASPQLIAEIGGEIPQTVVSGKLSFNGFLRGSLFDVPAGIVEAVFGVEYDRDRLHYAGGILDGVVLAPAVVADRTSYAAFTEARVPLWASSGRRVLDLSLAGRFDHYSDFGSNSTPQVGLEWRPAKSVLVRGSYGQSFKAPTLPQLYAPNAVFQSATRDPLTNQIVPITVTVGSNPELDPERGESYTAGFIYSSERIPGLELSATRWSVAETEDIQQIGVTTILDNPDLFSHLVTRAPGQNGQPGPVTEVRQVYINFGHIEVNGFDYQASYRHRVGAGTLSSLLSVTQTNRYELALAPGAVPIDSTSRAQNSGNWAPRWKAVAALGWKQGIVDSSFVGRYVGRYQDYDSTGVIGDFWIFDASVRSSVGSLFAGRSPGLKELTLSIGAVNVFNSMPEYSNFGGGYAGYDSSQADIRGRYLYLQLGTKL